MAGVGLSAGVTLSFKKLLLRTTRGRNRQSFKKLGQLLISSSCTYTKQEHSNPYAEVGK